MEACSRLGLVVIAAVSLLFCGVAEADNPCYAVCFKDCTSPFSCMFDPKCIATCGIKCGLRDTCKHSSRKLLLPDTVKHEEEEAVAIQRNTIEKNSLGVQMMGNPCYAECVQTCLNECGVNPWVCASCPGTCGLRDTCKDIKITSGKHEDVKKSHVADENSHVAVKPEEDVAVEIQSNSIEKNSVGIEVGNPCYEECVQICLNDCGFNIFSWICANCPATCALRDTCEDVAKSHVAGAVPKALLLNTHVAVADE